MSTQYRLKEDWKPVGSSKIAKKLADWMNAVAMQLNRAQVVSGGTARPTELGFRIEVDDDGDLGDFPFRLTYSVTSIRVRTGNWTRNGTTVTFTPDTGEEYKSITALADSSPFGASATYQVYAQLEHAAGTYDSALFPTRIGLYAAAALPTDLAPRSANKTWKIGTATTNADGEISGVTQTWWGGDIDDIGLVPDAESSYDPAGLTAGDFKLKSLNFRSYSPPGESTNHIQNLQIFEWDFPTEVNAASDGDLFMFQDVSEDDKPLRYIAREDLNVGSADYATNAGTAEVVTTLFEHQLEDHTDYSQAPTPGEKSAGRVPTCIDGSFWEWMAPADGLHTDLDFTDAGDGWAAIGVGKSGGNTDQDDVYWRAFNDGSGIAGHNTFIDSKTFKTSGLLEVTNTTAASGTGGAIYAPNGGIAGGKGCYFKRGTLQDFAGYFEESATEYARLCDPNGISRFKGNGFSVNICESSGVDVEVGNFSHAGVQGATASDATYVSGGLVLTKAGKTLTLIDASDLQPTDKLAVWR